MAFRDFPEQQDAVALLQRSLERGRLGHAYLFNGADLGELEMVARTLAKVLCCEQPPRRNADGLALDCCEGCASCRKVNADVHPDVFWLRPESKSRVIKVEQMRELLPTIYLKPTQAPFKVAIIAGADRLNVNAANAFLKTLEEPPADTVFILLSDEPQRILETILSRCLRLNFSGVSSRHSDPAFLEWMSSFAEMAGAAEKSLLGRYRLLSVLLEKLAALKESTEESMTKRSPLEKHDDIEPALKKQWEDELTAAVESEYRRQRSDVLSGLHWWLRDVWLHSLRLNGELLTFPEFSRAAQQVAGRMSPQQAMENLQVVESMQRSLTSNVQEALTLEVGLLRLKL